MGATLDALHHLQQIESRRHALKNKVYGKRREIRVLKGRVAKIQEKKDGHHEKTKVVQVDADRFELERQSREAEIAKLREQMKITKTNKEYGAIRTQINTLDADNRKLEERVLGLLTQLDDLKAEEEQIDKDLVDQTERFERFKRELVAIEAEVNPKLEELQAQHEEAAYHVPTTALQTFERIAEHNESQALARVTKPNAKRDEFICGGCQMAIPLQSVNAIMSTDEVQTCHICGRILYVEDPTEKDKKDIAPAS